MLRRQGVLHRLTFGPLSSEAVVQLLQEMSGSSEQGSLLGQRLYQETEGNPLFLLSLLYANAEAMTHYRAALALVGQGRFQPLAEDLREAHERLGDLYQAAG